MLDAVRNPFVPGAGSPPPELAGRKAVVDAAETAVLRMVRGRASKSQILVGLRGVGKTVLLNRYEQLAASHGCMTVFVEALEGKSLAALITPGLRGTLFKLSAIEKARVASRAALRALKSFVGSVGVAIGDIEIGLSIDPEPGVADSGDFEADLSALFVSVGEAARAAERPVVLIVDEMQYLSSQEFGALIMAVHRINQRELPLMLMGAALPQILGLAGESKSYAERLFDYPSIGALARADAAEALTSPALREGAKFEEDAVDSVIRTTEGYPYFLQQWAHEAWNIADDDVITLEDVEAATSLAISKLDENFFRVRFDRCTPSEKRYMRALAELGPGAHRSGDVADTLGVKVTSVGPTRGKLIRKGMIYSPQHGDTAFTVPLFDAYMRRAMPDIERM